MTVQLLRSLTFIKQTIRHCLFVLLCGLLLVIAPSSGVYADPLGGYINYAENRYLLGPGDVLSMQVQNEPEYSVSEILVSPDGHAYIAHIGDVYVEDRTVDDVTREITQRLDRLLVSPKITLSIIKTKPGMAYLSGAVMHPGMVQVATASNENNVHVNSEAPLSRTGFRLTNILVNAGGVKLNADLSQIRVTRAHNGQVVVVNLWRVIREGLKQDDLLINSGDAIYVPSLDHMALDDQAYQLLLESSLGPKTFKVRVIGEVNQPGVYALDGESPYLNTALVQAGGYASQAVRQAVAIRRFSDETHFTTFFVNPNKDDIVLRPNDVIYVAENNVYKSGRFMEQVNHLLSPFASAAQATSGVAQTFGLGAWGVLLQGR